MNNEIKYVSPFKKFCITVGNLPTAYLESMSYYEGLTYLVNYLSNNVIPALNNNSAVVEELQEQFTILKNYVDNYFENLDVQEEINNKLDEMAESGELTDIIAQYLGLAGMLVYNTVADLKAAQNLVNGSSCQTLGYYSINDGGKAKYKVRPITNEDVIDESTIIALYDNNLIAELILDDEINPEQLGCYGNGTNDDTAKFQITLNLQKNINLKENSTYLITGDINLPISTHIEGNNATIKFEYNGTREHLIRNNNWLVDTNYTNDIYLNNINFYLNSTTKHIKILGLSNYDKITIQNCFYNTNKSLTFGTCFIDMYSDNRNILIDNINVDITPTDNTLLNTNFSLRQYSPTGKTYNANITNSTFIHDGVDETVWIDGWFGELNNVNFINNKVIDKSTSDVTFCWIGLGTEGGSTPKPNSKMENIIIDNCIFEKDSLTYAAIKLGCISTEFIGLERLKNFVLRNSIINIKTGSGTAITSKDKSVSFENCNINYYGDVSYNFGYILSGSSILKKCTFNIYSTFSGASSAFAGNDLEFYNCTFNGNGRTFMTGGTRYIKNCIIKGIADLLYITASIENNITIDSCNIESTSNLFKRYNVTHDQLIIINNSDITSNETLFDNYAVSGNKDIRLNNTNFNTSNLKLSTVNSEVITINNCTINGSPITGIPSTSNDRASCVIGTVFNAGAGYTIVRKISAGADASNWETL